MNIGSLPISREEIAKIVISVVADTMCINVSDVAEETSFSNDLGMDSLDTAELLLNVEKEFSIDLDDSDIIKVTTVGQMIDCLHEAFNKMREELTVVSNGQPKAAN